MKTDTELRNDVLAQLEWDPQVTASGIGVAANEGIVTLSGHVPSVLQKHRAAEAAKRVAGVRGLANELEVLLPGGHHRTDAEIAAACVNALGEHVALPAEKIQVLVTGGVVTLEGEVEWKYQKDVAEEALRSLAGVVNVTNALTVKPRIAPRDIQSGIEAALRRHAEIDAARLSVETIGGKVILRGTLDSWSERDEAGAAAWSAPGVVAVDNRITVMA